MNSSIHSVFELPFYLSNRAGQVTILPSYLDIGMSGNFEGYEDPKKFTLLIQRMTLGT